MTPVLAGVRVLDFGGGLAGALTAHLLAEQGALVSRIARPGIPAPRHLRFAAVHTADLTTTEGRTGAARLLDDADVVVENFRPGVMKRLGFGAEAVCARRPHIIYLRLPGFPGADPQHSETAAWEGALGAACGLFTDVNLLRSFLGLPPVYSALPHASVYGAVHGALAVTLALLARERGGRGDVIEVPLAAAALSAMGSTAMKIDPQPSRYDLPEVPAWTRGLVPVLRAVVGRLPTRLQQAAEHLGQTAIPALMSSYQCADGRLLYVFAVDHDRLPQRLLEVLGVWPRLQAAGLASSDPYAPGAGQARANLAESTRLSLRWQRRLRGALAGALRQRPAAEWEAILTQAGVPCAVQRSTQDWLQLPELAEAGIVTSRGEGAHSVHRPGPAAWVEQTAAVAPSPVHDVPPAASATRLAGCLVLDLSTMVAGPVCGRTLAEYGARVIKIDSPKPHHGPRLTCWYGVDVNQGKQSALVDLRHPEGNAAFRRLLVRADVLLHNFSDLACARLGLDGSDLRAVNPRLVCARIGAFRGPLPGPLDQRKGYDPVLQACAGIMRRYGGDAEPVHHGIASCIDYLTGYLAAMSVALGLLQRERAGGAGCDVGTSLAQAANLIQLPFAVNDPAMPAPPEPMGQWAWGEGPLHRLYRARDGWVFLAASPVARDAICRALSVPGAVDDATLARQLGRALRRYTVSQLQSLLRHPRVAISAVKPLDTLCSDALEPPSAPGSLVSDGAALRATVQSGADGAMIRTLIPTYARARSAPLLHLAPAPRLGADTREVLAEFGLGDAVDRLLHIGAASEGLHPRALPD